MEKYGLALTHSDQPNFTCRPFANAITGKVVSLAWPVEEIKQGDSCSRDCVPLLFPGESPEQRAARKDVILSFARTGYVPTCMLVAPGYQAIQCCGLFYHNYQATFCCHRGWMLVSSRKLLTPPTTVPSPSLTAVTSFNPTNMVKLYISGSSSGLKEWSSIEGYTIVGTIGEADVILGDRPTHKAKQDQLVARMGGDECLVSRGRLCVLARDKEWFARGVDLKSEPGGILCGGESLLSSWRILLPAERGAPVQPQVTRNKVEIIRWAETAPCVASQCEFLLAACCVTILPHSLSLVLFPFLQFTC